ncbi:YutD family protein [Kurthia sibirica]|uniref:DUF1027 domain-containing protein n=1 Tax=Kurthia sibirica TaxID=202750 RepID=A0A2U3AI07_9BACL|nr:YutD family protein [Kurthia sibirica]PWI24178.1 DUF1027 domain-containing protein [Kurthia sibirica]GEK34702.1 hypothetical protein KSI01_22350 [Kurthia sibirica]
MIIAGSFEYTIEKDYREAFTEEDFTNRFSDILAKYDFIVGDWGYGQLRLKGFYDDQNTKATFDTKIGTFQDYLYEYCNFGAAYFILKKGEAVKIQTEDPIVEKETPVEENTTEASLDIEAEQPVATDDETPTQQ